MGLIASLDMGSEKMVMALAADDGSVCRLTGIKIVASQGMERGVVKDREKASACIRGLMADLIKDREVEVMNVALSGEYLHALVRKITVPVQKKVVSRQDLLRAEDRCIAAFEGGDHELIDVIPVSYSIDHGEGMAAPLGCPGRNLEVTYQVYVADGEWVSDVRRLFDGSGVGEVCFYPAVRAYAEALDIEHAEADCALVDFGARAIKVALFRDRMLEYKVTLPLGMRAIDLDIMSAYAVTAGQARKMKHEFGQAMRSQCKNKKLQIPDTRLTLESRDLAMVVQSRAEELLEGVVFQLQCWGFDCPEDRIWITGGGSRLVDLDVLLHRMSGHPVAHATVKGIQTSREDVLKIPEYFVALGLLLCDRREPQEKKGSLLNRLKDLFGK